MGYPNKIVTCCYCGTRAALVLRGRTRHELTCSSCGAPLHDLKMLPKDRMERREPVDRPVSRPRPIPPARKKRVRKKRKSLFKKVVAEAIDFLDDIFD